MSFPWAAVGAAASSLIGTVGQGFANRANWRRYKNDRRYNEPINQMKRLKAAGLNPHLMYGQGTVATTSKGNPPKAEFETPDVVAGIAQYQNIKNAIIQENILKEEERRRTSLADQAASKASTDAINAQVYQNLYANHKDIFDQEALDLKRYNIYKGIQQIAVGRNMERIIDSQIQQRVADTIFKNASKSYTEIRTAVEKEILRLRKADINPNDTYLMKKLGQTVDAILNYFGINPSKQ